MAEEVAPQPVEFKGKTFKPLADGKYDAIILGTGLKECILSGLLSVKGKKVSYIHSVCLVAVLKSPNSSQASNQFAAVLTAGRNLFFLRRSQVLHLDRNSYYGGECASLNLSVSIVFYFCTKSPRLFMLFVTYFAMGFASINRRTYSRSSTAEMSLPRLFSTRLGRTAITTSTSSQSLSWQMVREFISLHMVGACCTILFRNYQ